MELIVTTPASAEDDGPRRYTATKGKATIAALQECAEAGFTLTEAAAYVGIVYAYASRLAKEHQVPFAVRQYTKKSSKKSSDRQREICDYFLSGNYSLQDVGDRFGVTRERIRQVLAKNGISERYRSLPAFTLPIDDLLRLYEQGEDVGAIVRRHGTTRKMFYKHVQLGEESKHKRNIVMFWRSVTLTANPDKCWEWVGNLDPNGYGRKRFEGRSRYIHAISFRLHHGRWSKKWVLHKCDNRRCCNPNHLYEGSPADNVRDRDDRGRAAHQTGKPGRRLSFEDRQLIKELIARGITQDKVAEIVGFTLATVNRVNTGKSKGNPIDLIPTPQLRHIYNDLVRGRVTGAYVSKRYGLHPQTVSNIKRGTHSRVKKFLQ